MVILSGDNETTYISKFDIHKEMCVYVCVCVIVGVRG